ncbi:MAG: hypothetical protein KKA79_09720 [Nanoarchaeota archaeon]|nr:hypothetical protein [Nanoarchaeota archaeon]MCG2718615.1 hypothetical protein [Nanoarchaeota archaeon]
MARKDKIITCQGCGKELPHCAKGFCHNCYRKVGTPKIICSVCNKEKPNHAKGMCSSCYVKILHYDKIKASNIKRYHNISLAEWKAITKDCIICGFDKIVELHHLDKNKENNHENNLVGLCPNHHKMLHCEKYEEEVVKEIKKKLNKI